MGVARIRKGPRHDPVMEVEFRRYEIGLFVYVYVDVYER